MLPTLYIHRHAQDSPKTSPIVSMLDGLPSAISYTRHPVKVHGHRVEGMWSGSDFQQVPGHKMQSCNLLTDIEMVCRLVNSGWVALNPVPVWSRLFPAGKMAWKLNLLIYI
jgi:hypothetical protein